MPLCGTGSSARKSPHPDTEQAKNCANCHVLYGVGIKIGPDLTAANRKDKDFLLTSLVDPSAVIRKEFANYSVKTKDGRTFSGTVVEEGADYDEAAGSIDFFFERSYEFIGELYWRLRHRR